MTWDEYFMHIAEAVACNSKCLSRQLGAVIVRDKHIISTGYNGPPAGVAHCYPVCSRRSKGYNSGQGLEHCPAAHAEANAIALAARYGAHTDGCKMYLNFIIPCRECAKMIINSGIREVIVKVYKVYDYVGKGEYTNTGLDLMQEAGVIVRTTNWEEPMGMYENLHKVNPDRRKLEELGLSGEQIEKCLEELQMLLDNPPVAKPDCETVVLSILTIGIKARSRKSLFEEIATLVDEYTGSQIAEDNLSNLVSAILEAIDDRLSEII